MRGQNPADFAASLLLLPGHMARAASLAIHNELNRNANLAFRGLA